MSPLAKRVLSSLFSIAVLIFDYLLFKTDGVVILGAIVIFAGAFEYQRLSFAHFNISQPQRFWFMLNCVALVILNLNSNTPALSESVIIFVVASTGTLWLHKNSINNTDLLNIIAFSILGYFYCALVPIFALKILFLNYGIYWFIFLCSTVFSGDVMAYLGGRLCGKHKLLPSISPNKTLEGAIAGFCGSLVAAALVGTIWLPFVPMSFVILIAGLCSLLAQSGDLFESLLKRVANVKDSGAIMPGHGGLLDRLDGLYFAAPIVYFAAQSI